MSEDYKPSKPARRTSATYVNSAMPIKPADNMRQSDKVQLNLMVDKEWRNAFKSMCALDGTTMVKVIYEAVEMWVEKNKGGNQDADK